MVSKILIGGNSIFQILAKTPGFEFPNDLLGSNGLSVLIAFLCDSSKFLLYCHLERLVSIHTQITSEMTLCVK